MQARDCRVVMSGRFDDHIGMLKLTLAGTVVLAVGAACSNGGPAPTVALLPATAHKRAPAPVKKGPTVEEQTADMVLAATPGKSDVPVSLKFDLPQRPKIGAPLDLNIALLAQIPAESAQIDVSAPNGLELASIDARTLIRDVRPDEVYRHTLQLTPTAAGVLFLNLNVTLKHDEITETRSFTVPLILEDERSANSTAGPTINP